VAMMAAEPAITLAPMPVVTVSRQPCSSRSFGRWGGCRKAGLRKREAERWAGRADRKLRALGRRHWTRQGAEARIAAGERGGLAGCSVPFAAVMGAAGLRAAESHFIAVGVGRLGVLLNSIPLPVAVAVAVAVAGAHHLRDERGVMKRELAALVPQRGARAVCMRGVSDAGAAGGSPPSGGRARRDES
jgi:hypothetical protein